VTLPQHEYLGATRKKFKTIPINLRAFFAGSNIKIQTINRWHPKRSSDVGQGITARGQGRASPFVEEKMFKNLNFNNQTRFAKRNLQWKKLGNHHDVGQGIAA